ncbi:MAG: mechanosensitive ion channel family protein [Candidatus Micrarchaeota archaeon]|nr:mechanosensitive ion channel family protein [Candidatus Micrarchaeota archaeon]
MGNATEALNESIEAVYKGIVENSLIYGNSLLQYAEFLGILLLFYLLSKLVYMLFVRYLRQLAKNTKTEMDDILIEISEGPIIMFVLILGLYVGKSIALNAGSAPYVFIDGIFEVLLTINVAWLLLRFIDSFVVRYMRKHAERSDAKLNEQLISLVRNVLRIIIILLTIIFLLSNLGFDVTALIAGLGIGGIAVALAAQDTISNFIGAIVIFTSKPFKINDFVRIGQYSGTVKQISLRTTRLELLSGTHLIIPNNKVVTDVVENFTMAQERMVEQVIGLSYDYDSRKLENVIKLLVSIVSAHPNISRHDIRFMEYGTYSQNINMRYWVNNPDKLRETIHDINLQMKKAFEKEKISLAFPTQTVQVKK